MTLCLRCQLAHDDTQGCVDTQSAAMLALLKNIGDFARCRGCNAEIYWVTHRNGKVTPYTPAGLNHFIDCPQAERFKTKTPGLAP